MAARTLKCDIEFGEDTEEVSVLMKSGEHTLSLSHVEDCENVFDKPVETLNIVDVYNVASSVGQEFERLTDAFGGAVFSGVMPKIIRILEMLESLVAQKEAEANEVAELNSSLQKLQMDSKLKDEKQQEEIEIVESVWKDETKGLMETVATLEEDNQTLTALLSDKLQEDNEITFQPEQTALISKLQEQLAKQRDEIRAKNKCIEEQTRESDALQSQIQRLAKLNTEIRNKAYILERQAKSLIEQKMDLETKMNKNGKDLAEIQLRSLKQQENHKGSVATPHKETNTTEIDHSPIVDPLLANKLIIDLNDPNRPRYTLKELQEVLTDRNQLKARCFLLEEELIFHRGEETWEELNDSEIKESRDHVYRPDHTKPTESGVRRFFNYLTGDGSWYKSEATRPVVRRPKAPHQKPSHHRVVEEVDQKNLVSQCDIEELVPDPRLDLDVTNLSGKEPKSSEMKVLSPLEERNEFSP